MAVSPLFIFSDGEIIIITTWDASCLQHCLECYDGSLLYLDLRHISSAYVDILCTRLLNFQSGMFSNTGHLCWETMFVKCKHKFNWMCNKYIDVAMLFHIKNNESQPCSPYFTSISCFFPTRLLCPTYILSTCAKARVSNAEGIFSQFLFSYSLVCCIK